MKNILHWCTMKTERNLRLLPLSPNIFFSLSLSPKINVSSPPHFCVFYHIILNLCFIHRQSYTLSSFIFMYYVLKPVGEALLLKKQNWDVHNFDKNQAEMLDGSILRTKWMTRLSFDQKNSFSWFVIQR